MKHSPRPSGDGFGAVDSDLVATAREAYLSIRDEIEAVPDGELSRINVDLPLAARRGLVAAERIGSLLPIMARMPHFDVHRVAKLRLYALALMHAHAEVLSRSGEGPSLTPLLDEADVLRDRMLRTADVLVHYGVVSPARVAALRGGHGYAHVVDSLHGLSRLFDDLWPRVQGRVMVTREMIARAATLSTELLEAVGEREARRNPLAVRTSPRHRRSQAFTLFARAYEEARRGASFLRWYERDATDVIPSLHGHRRERRRAVAMPPPSQGLSLATGGEALDEQSSANDTEPSAVPA